MKKENQQPNLLKTNIGSTKNLATDSIKTTNINILLNRVKEDQKKESRKKLLFTAATSIGVVLFGVLVF